MANHQSIKNQYAKNNQGKRVMSISEYVAKTNEWDGLPGRIYKPGIMEVLYQGKWYEKKEFEKIFPRPVIFSFNVDVTNCDGTKKWML